MVIKSHSPAFLHLSVNCFFFHFFILQNIQLCHKGLIEKCPADTYVTCNDSVSYLLSLCLQII